MRALRFPGFPRGACYSRCWRPPCWPLVPSTVARGAPLPPFPQSSRTLLLQRLLPLSRRLSRTVSPLLRPPPSQQEALPARPSPRRPPRKATPPMDLGPPSPLPCLPSQLLPRALRRHRLLRKELPFLPLPRLPRHLLPPQAQLCLRPHRSPPPHPSCPPLLRNRPPLPRSLPCLRRLPSPRPALCRRLLPRR